MSLETLQSSFVASCLDEAHNITKLSLSDTSDTANQRLSIYRNNILSSLQETLSSTFSSVCALVGEDFFFAMAKEYIGCSPPYSGCVYEYGDSLPAFINSFAPAKSVPYLSEVANYEWQWHCTYTAKDDTPISHEELLHVLSTETIEALCLRDHVHLCRATFPVHDIHQFAQGKSATAPNIEIGEYHYLLHRPELDVITHEITQELFTILYWLSQGEDFNTASGHLLEKFPNIDMEQIFSGIIGLQLLKFGHKLGDEDGSSTEDMES